MSRMHRPEIDRATKKPLEMQNKRSVVAIEEHDFDRWLTCSPEQAREMMELIPVNLIDAGPVRSQELQEVKAPPLVTDPEELLF